MMCVVLGNIQTGVLISLRSEVKVAMEGHLSIIAALVIWTTGVFVQR